METIPKVSVITVVRNAEHLLPSFFKSVKKYKTSEVEFIVIDGASTDGTFALISQNADLIDQFVSEADAGIYDAMNKSTKLANGKWLYFLGADDFLLEGFANILPHLENENTIYYGGVIFNHQPISRSFSPYQLTKENICHQAIFYPRAIFKKYLYDIRYTVFADFHLNIRCWTDFQFKSMHLDYIVAEFTPGGYSDKTPDKAYFDDKEVWFRNYLSNKDFMRYINRTAGIKGFLGYLLGIGTKNTQPFKLASGKPIILMIDDEVPAFDKSSGARRIYEVIKILLRLNYEIVFIANNQIAVEPYYSELSKLGVRFPILPNGKKSVIKEVRRIAATVDFGWIARPTLNTLYQPILKQKGVKCIFDTVDLHFIRVQRQAEISNNKKLHKKALKLKKQELNLARSADATLTVTSIEQQLLVDNGVKNIFTIPNVHSMADCSGSLPWADRKGLLFIGGYLHEPNVDAVVWFINEILPLVTLKLGAIPVYILGSNPPDTLLSLKSHNIFIPGYISDVSEYFFKSRIFISPLRYGAGMKGKIGQSLEYGLPVVSTTIGAEGMNLIDSENVLLADNSQAFADQIVKLYTDETLWMKIAARSESALEKYSPNIVGEKIKDLFAHLTKLKNA